MMQVADASVIAGLLLEDEGEARDWCRKRVREASLVAPHLLLFEVVNIIRRKVAHGALGRVMADQALRWLMTAPVELVPFDLLAERTWTLKDNLTTYDASYVAAAERFECRFVTLDRKIAGAPDIRCEVLLGPV